MTPPTWLDAHGRRRPTLACWTLWPRGRADVLAGRRPPATGLVAAGDPVDSDWCGCSTEYLPVLVGAGWWQLVPIWEPDQTANPLRRWEPAVPYWASET